MASIINNLNKVKEKLALMNHQKNNEVTTDFKDAKSRMLNKVNLFFKDYENKIEMNIGGERTIKCSKNTFLDFSYFLSIRKQIEDYNGSPIFVDISYDLWEPMNEIIRLNPLNDFSSYNIIVKSEMALINSEAEKLFGNDWSKIKKLVKFVNDHSNKRLNSINEKEKSLLNHSNLFWNSDVSIKCFKCLKENEGGNLWRIRCSGKKLKNSEFIFNDHYACCIFCDYKGTLVYK